MNKINYATLIRSIVTRFKGGAFFSLLLWGCVYSHTYVVASIEVSLGDNQKTQFLQLLRDYSKNEGLALVDRSLELPNVEKTSLYDMTNSQGDLVITLTGLGNGRSFSLNFYSLSNESWMVRYEYLLQYLKEEMPKAKYKKVLRDN